MISRRACDLNTNNVNMNSMFLGYSSLTLLPNISNCWISNVKDICCMFSYCSSLLSLPDVSKWCIINVEKLDDMFRECTSLSSSSDIFKWDTSRVSHIDGGTVIGCLNLHIKGDKS